MELDVLGGERAEAEEVGEAARARGAGRQHGLVAEVGGLGGAGEQCRLAGGVEAEVAAGAQAVDRQLQAADLGVGRRDAEGAGIEGRQLGVAQGRQVKALLDLGGRKGAAQGKGLVLGEGQVERDHQGLARPRPAVDRLGEDGQGPAAVVAGAG